MTSADIERGMFIIAGIAVLATFIATIYVGMWWIFPALIGGVAGFFLLAAGLGKLTRRSHDE